MNSLCDLVEKLDPCRIHSAALRLLEKVGMQVSRAELRDRLATSSGLRIVGDRVHFSREVVEEFANELRSRPVPPPRDEGPLVVFCSRLPFFFVDPEDGEMKPFTVPILKQYTRLVDSLRADGFEGSVPGWPQDVSPHLRPVVQYYIECRYSRGAHYPGIAAEPKIIDCLRRIAGVMGHSFSVGVETFSPLALGGNSLDSALHYQSEIEAVGLDPMPILGVTAPLDWEAGWAQSVAENLGAGTALRLLGFKRVSPSFRLFPASMKSSMIAFGSAEYLTALLTRWKVRQFYHTPRGCAESMMTSAKLPDEHAAAEKAALTALTTTAGWRRVEGAGMLFADEIFSPQQLVIDLEIRDYIEKSLRGGPASTGQGDRTIEDICQLVSQGLGGSGFLDAPNTLEHWREFYRLPSLFCQTSRAQWETKRRKLLDVAWEFARARGASHSYELTGAKLAQLDRILVEACTTFGEKSLCREVLRPL